MVARRQDIRPLFEAFEPNTWVFMGYLTQKKAAGFSSCFVFRESRCQFQDFVRLAFAGRPVTAHFTAEK